MKAERDETFINRDCDDVCTANIHITTDEERYWKQVRVQAAIAAMQGMMSNSSFNYRESSRNYANDAVIHADALIAELRKGSPQ